MKGFTLIEVLVALAILSTSSVVFGTIVGFFNQQRSLERSRANAFVCAVETMESLIDNPPSCEVSTRPSSHGPATSRNVDSGIPCDSAVVALRPVPGVVPLSWAQVQVSTVSFRRLVKCVK